MHAHIGSAKIRALSSKPLKAFLHNLTTESALACNLVLGVGCDCAQALDEATSDKTGVPKSWDKSVRSFSVPVKTRSRKDGGVDSGCGRCTVASLTPCGSAVSSTGTKTASVSPDACRTVTRRSGEGALFCPRCHTRPRSVNGTTHEGRQGTHKSLAAVRIACLRANNWGLVTFSIPSFLNVINAASSNMNSWRCEGSSR